MVGTMPAFCNILAKRSFFRGGGEKFTGQRGEITVGGVAPGVESRHITKVPLLKVSRVAHVNNFMYGRLCRPQLIDDREIRTRAHCSTIQSQDSFLEKKGKQKMWLIILSFKCYDPLKKSTSLGCLTDLDVLVPGVNHPLVDLVGHTDDIVFPAQLSHHLQLLQCEDLDRVQINKRSSAFLLCFPHKDNSVTDKTTTVKSHL